MSTASNPTTRTIGQALVVAPPAARGSVVALLGRLGFECAQADEPYSAMRELVRRPLVYRAVVLSLAGLYREELAIIPTLKRRLPHLDVLLTQTDGRQSSLADGLRLGADGLLDDEGIHRISGQSGATFTPTSVSDQAETKAPHVAPAAALVRAERPPRDDSDDEFAVGDPVLTADELRALLQDPSTSQTEGDD